MGNPAEIQTRYLINTSLGVLLLHQHAEGCD